MTVKTIIELLAILSPVPHDIYNVLGYTDVNDGGGGTFFWDPTSTIADNGGTVFKAAGAPAGQAGRWIRLFNGDAVNVKWFGAKGVGNVNDTGAFQRCLSAYHDVYIPTGVYSLRTAFNLNHHLKGDGMNKTVLLFSQCSTAAIKANNYNTSIRNLTIKNEDWQQGGCTSYGLEVEINTHVENVSVTHFRKSNVFLHHQLNSDEGPYYAIFRNIYTAYSGEHGFLVGTGANAVYIEELISRWNGAPAYNVAPSQPGNYDGFLITDSGDGNPNDVYKKYKPEGVILTGGDCSYNSRFGWNIDACNRAKIQTSYAEFNKDTRDIRLGTAAVNSDINFAMGSPEGLLPGSGAINNVYIGGIYYGTGGAYDTTYGRFTNNILRNSKSVLTDGGPNGNYIFGTSDLNGNYEFGATSADVRLRLRALTTINRVVAEIDKTYTESYSNALKITTKDAEVPFGLMVALKGGPTVHDRSVLLGTQDQGIADGGVIGLQVFGSGRVCIGTDTGNQKLNVNGNVAASGIVFTPIAAANAQNNQLFVDIADKVLKLKRNDGTIVNIS